jgi:4'-phosphopantetheinyl transferase
MNRSAPPAWQTPDAFPHLATDEIHLWYADIGAQDCHADWLSAAERERQLAHRGLERQRHFCAVRCILRDLLSRYLARPPDALDIQVEPTGKPYLAAGEVQFNLSHSRERLLLAFARDTQLGVDLELKRPVNNIPQIARRLFTPEEYAALQQRDFAMGAFLDIWTRHEARQKCLGRGIFGERPPHTGIHTRTIPIDGAQACVAWAGQDSPPRLRCFTYPPDIPVSRL